MFCLVFCNDKTRCHNNTNCILNAYQYEFNEGTPSPARKKRNNSTPTKTRAADEKRLILETLIAPATIDTSNRPKVITYEKTKIKYKPNLNKQPEKKN